MDIKATLNKSRESVRLISGWGARRKPQTWRGHGESEAGNSGSMLPACVATRACKPGRTLQGVQRRGPPEIGMRDARGLVQRSLKYFSLACIGILAGCAAGPDYRPPQQVDEPPAWPALSDAAHAGSTITQQPFDGKRWWTVFHDPLLNRLVAEAVRQNLDLRIAASRIRQARAQRAATAAGLLPSASLSAAGLRNRMSENGLASSLGGGSSGAGSTGGAGEQGGGAAPSNTFQLGFDALWELDLWGKTRRAVEAADADTEAAVENRRAALVSLTAEIARAYFALLGAQSQLRITRNDLTTQRRLLELTRSRAEAGFTSQSDVLQAQTQVAAGEAALPQLEQAVEQGYNRLALLLALPPGALKKRLDRKTALPSLPPAVPVGLPGDLLRRRPDIRRSEAQLHAATARVGVAVAQLFPSVRLGVASGLEAGRLADLADWASRFFLLGTAISIPVFEGGQIKANIQISEAQTQEALLRYRQTVLEAYHDADDAMIAYAKEQQRMAALTRKADYARRSLELTTAQYRQGIAAFLNVLDAERNLHQTQLQLTQSAVDTTTDLVALFKALGGDWSSG